MEKLYGHRLEAEIERLAYHAFRGELWTQAASYLEQAGDKAMARCAFADATAWFEQAITTHTHLPQTRETLEQGIDIRFDLRNALNSNWRYGTNAATFARCTAYCPGYR
jgi:hypothetical protein